MHSESLGCSENTHFTKNVQKEYADISELYKEVNTKSDRRKYTLLPTVIANLPNLKSKKVVDLAAGEGYWARLLKSLGSESVVAIDISPEMVELGKKTELSEKNRIEFLLGDACEFLLEEKVDLVFAAFLLHYSETKEELKQMCRNIADNLLPGGQFITLNINPDMPNFDGRKYFLSIEAEEGDHPSEGSRIKITNYDKTGKNAPFSFHNYYWSKSTYQQALEAAGFVDIIWHQLSVSKEGIESFPIGYWNDYLKSPTCLLTCRKAK